MSSISVVCRKLALPAFSQLSAVNMIHVYFKYPLHLLCQSVQRFWLSCLMLHCCFFCSRKHSGINLFNMCSNELFILFYFFLKDHYVKIGLLCHLAPPTVAECDTSRQCKSQLCNKLLTTNKAHDLITMSCVTLWFYSLTTCMLCNSFTFIFTDQFILSSYLLASRF